MCDFFDMWVHAIYFLKIFPFVPIALRERHAYALKIELYRWILKIMEYSYVACYFQINTNYGRERRDLNLCL